MKRLAGLLLLSAALLSAFWVLRARGADSDETQIHNLLDRWTKAFEAKDVNGVMAIYAPGQELLAYDVVPPLQYAGFDAYKKDYQEFFDGFDGPVHIEFRNLKITTGGAVAFATALERVSGKMKNGQNFDAWLRATECYRKINGRWLAVHDHISAPTDFATGKAALNLKP